MDKQVIFVSECFFLFSRGSLNTHLQTHEGKERGMYQCGQCDMMLTTAGSVRRHMAVHQVSRVKSSWGTRFLEF